MKSLGHEKGATSVYQQPPMEISLLKKTIARQQVQPQGGRFDTGADSIWALHFSEPERSIRLFNTTIIPDYFNRV